VLLLPSLLLHSSVGLLQPSEVSQWNGMPDLAELSVCALLALSGDLLPLLEQKGELQTRL